MDFRAPDAKILVVDDNRMSLKLAERVLASLGVQIDSAESGEKALEMVREKKYQMIFMDYLMPEMDGLETTRLIREMNEPYYQRVPIVALTGDEAADRGLFAEVGICDFLLKPLKRDFLKAVLGKWLPAEFLVYEEIEDTKEEEWPELQGIDVAQGLKNSGGREHFIDFLGDFYKLIDAKADKLEKCMAEKLIKEYTIEVHALKNSARIIGAMELSERFQRMEQLGKAGEVELIEKELPELLALYRSYKPILKPYGVKENAGKKKASVEEIIYYLRGLQEAVEAFDMDRADEAMARLEEFCMPERCKPLMEKLRVAVADVAMENILIMTEEMISFINS